MLRVDPKHYTKKYYLSDASGFEEYKRSFGKELEPRLLKIVQKIPLKNGMRVLDIGCGRGELVYWAAKNGAGKVIGIDYSKNAISLSDKAKKKWHKRMQDKIIFKEEDALQMKFDNNSFDLIIMTEVFEHLYQEEQVTILKKIHKMLNDEGILFIHTAPSKWFNNHTYKYWCYPVSSILVAINNLFTEKKYPNVTKPDKVRTVSHNIMHVNEPDYFSLRKVYSVTGFRGKILSTNTTVSKPIISWKDRLYNFLVYLSPLSNYPPINFLWGNDFYSILRKR
jgi:cyclopropane fatty-acyl-phospholipid synthase-like methyltransferase